MKVPSSLAPLFLCLGFATTTFLQSPSVSSSAQAASSPKYPAVAATIGEDRIEMEAYRDHLVLVSGRRPLDTLIDRRLIENEAKRLNLEVQESEVTEAVTLSWDSYLLRLDGEEERFVDELTQSGYAKAEVLRNLENQARHNLLAAAVCLNSREVTDEFIEEHFQSRYGQNGDLVEVRHIFLSPARLKADLISQGTPAVELGAIRLDALCVERLEEVLERLEGGEEFGALAAIYSHEFAAKASGGLFSNYNYRAYGEVFADAVRAAEVGVAAGPVRTDSGFHLIEVVSRVHTELDDVREELRAELLLATPEQSELQALVERLRAAVEIETY